MKWLKNLFKKWFNAKVIKAEQTPVEPSKPTEPVKPIVLNDDPECNIIIKFDGKEIKNVGQVTYEKRVVTCRPFDGHTCVCIQYDVTGVLDGERTVFKNEARMGIVVESLPTDIPIGKLVTWYR